ncbi:hypothetical protein H6G80_28050 [Nostoc sp. FACHB-87]|uniref:hypothetical protein n=1 Tax=Nostocaceae TaxID=1162 RepID=UPI001686012B|nr:MULTISPECIES: hypothetical protein [Nostocaceae]MBD2457906.1 hypothetical protein [Nostoc sp. FACHB-87]MBD2478867.1 hypothetical protein [Anabaena sp. FACHB-83]
MQKKISHLKKFTFVVIFAESLIVIPMLVLTLGKSINLKCHRLEPNYVKCQQQVSHLYGLWSNTSTSFRLTDVELEEYVFKEDLPEGTYIYLKTNNQGEELYFYGSNLKTALADKERLETLLSNSGQASLEITVKDTYWSALDFLKNLVGLNISIIFSIALFFLIILIMFALILVTASHFFNKTK